jgi:hypothetical protein
MNADCSQSIQAFSSVEEIMNAEVRSASSAAAVVLEELS